MYYAANIAKISYTQIISIKIVFFLIIIWFVLIYDLSLWCNNKG